MNSETIFRTHKRRDDPYITVDKALINNRRLGWDTRGLLAYLLGKPDDWEVRMSDLLNQGPAKQTALRRMIKEAEAHGYMRRERQHTTSGKFIWVTHVYEIPYTPYAGFPSMGEPSMGEPSMENLHIYQGMNLPSNELPSNELPSNEPPPPIVPNTRARGGSNGGGGDGINHRGLATRLNGRQALALALIVDNLPAWNAPEGYVTTRNAADLDCLLSWLWLIDTIHRAKTASAYSVDGYYAANAVADYEEALSGIRDLTAYIVSRTGGGRQSLRQAARLTAADRAALDDAIDEYTEQEQHFHETRDPEAAA